MGDSFVVGKERCPKCAKLGKDRNEDNLAIYNDGHKYCFSCGYSIHANGVSSFVNQGKEDSPQKVEVFLPHDCCIDYPQRALDWVAQYELTRTDLLNNNALWSEQEQRLIFPIYGDGSLIAWQGRWFGLEPNPKQKWFGRGNLKDTFNILGKGDRLYLTEDVISAIKVAKCGVLAMPLYGSFVGSERFKRLYKMLGKEVEVWIWLDPDKRPEAFKEAHRGALAGLSCGTMYSELDPKELEYVKIKSILANAG